MTCTDEASYGSTPPCISWENSPKKMHTYRALLQKITRKNKRTNKGHTIMRINTASHTKTHSKRHTPKDTHKKTHTKRHIQKDTHQKTLTKRHTQKDTHKKTHTKRQPQKDTHKKTHTERHTQTTNRPMRVEQISLCASFCVSFSFL